MNDPGGRKTLREAARLLVTSWKAVVAVAGGLVVISGLVGLVFHPPWAGGSSGGNSATNTNASAVCPGVSEGRISNVTADQRVRLSSYWQLNPGARASVSKQRLKALGQVVHFRVDIRGYRGKKLTVWWWTLTANGAPVAEPTLQRQLAFALTPNDCTTGGTRDVWTQLPNRKGRYKVEIQLLDPQGEQLDYGRTNPFVVRRATST
jgi:hypothetical protein